MTKEQKILLALLRIAFLERAVELELFKSVDEKMWSKVLKLATENGVLAIIYGALSYIPQELQPPRAIKLYWTTNAIAAEERAEKYLNTLVSLAQEFEKENIKTLLLKGYTLSRLYPVPAYRYGGDIDIFLFDDFEKGNEVIRNLGLPVRYKQLKHSNFRYNNISVENHRMFFNIERRAPFYKKAEKLLQKYVREFDCPTIDVAGTSFYMLPPIANLMFVTIHSAVHFAAWNFRLRSICDWTMLVKSCYKGIDAARFFSDLKTLGLQNFVENHLYISKKYFDLPEGIFAKQTKCRKKTDYLLTKAINLDRRKKITFKEKWQKWLFTFGIRNFVEALFTPLNPPTRGKRVLRKRLINLFGLRKAISPSCGGGRGEVIAGITTLFVGNQTLSAIKAMPNFAPFVGEFRSPDITIYTDEPIEKVRSETIDLIYQYADERATNELFTTSDGYLFVSTLSEGRQFFAKYTTGSNEIHATAYILPPSPLKREFGVATAAKSLLGDVGGTTPEALLFSLWLAFTLPAAWKNALAIHASCIVYEGAAVLFLGESGTGKSTHTRLWQENIPNCFLLNDDSPFLKIEDGKIVIYGSPWSGKTPCYRNEKYPLKAIVRLSQASYNKIQKLDLLNGFAAVYPSCAPHFADNETLTDKMTEILSEVMKQTPVYSLACLPNAEAAKLVRETVFQNND